jgi:uncharacterized protein (TIGR03000 family)
LASRFSGCYGYSCYSTACNGGSCLGSSCFGTSCLGYTCLGGSGFGSDNPPGVFGPTGPQSGWAAHGVYYAAPGAIPRGHPTTITPGPGSGCFGDSYLNYSCYGSPIFLNRSATLTQGTHYGDPIYSPTSWGYGVGFGSGPIYYGVDFQPNYNACCAPGLGVIIPQTNPMIPPQVRLGAGFEVAKATPAAAPARLTIDLPADAKLFVDGVATKGEGPSRNFHTPDLPGGQTFYYELKAELVVDGKPVTETKKVVVTAGDALRESFPRLVAAAAAAKEKEATALAKK